MASETTASDRRARAGGELNGVAEANGAELAALWEEAAKEHGGDVFVFLCGGCGRLWAEMGGSVRMARMGKSPPRK